MRVAFAVVAAAAVLLAACQTTPASAAAVVNGVPIPHETVEGLVRAAADLSDPLADPKPEEFASVDMTQRQVLSELVFGEILAQGAQRLGVSVSDAAVDEQFAALVARYGDEQTLRREVARAGLTLDDVRARLELPVLLRQLEQHLAGEVVVSDAEVRAVYRERADEFRVAKAAHILVETREEAAQVLAELRRGADFATLARERSNDPGSAANGGSLGENPPGTFVAPFDEAVWSARPGELVGPVETEYGWHVIRVDALRLLPFADVADQLRTQLRDQKVGEDLRSWLSEADVDVDPRFGRWDPETGQVVTGDTAPQPPAVGDQAS